MQIYRKFVEQTNKQTKNGSLNGASPTDTGQFRKESNSKVCHNAVMNSNSTGPMLSSSVGASVAKVSYVDCKKKKKKKDCMHSYTVNFLI